MRSIAPRGRIPLKRNPKQASKEKKTCALEKVLGFTITTNASVSLDPTSGAVAYPAGSIVVGYLAKKNKQFFIHNTAKCPITTISFSRDGKLLATGESGKHPKVRVWNVESRTQQLELSGHNFRINALAFSPSSRYLVSVGSQEDMLINVWELWSGGTRIASSKVTCRVNALAFCEGGDWFVTVGVRHVRYWYIESNPSSNFSGPNNSGGANNSDNRIGGATIVDGVLGASSTAGSNTAPSNRTKPLNGRNAVLKDFMNNTFNDVACCYISGDKSSMTASQISSSDAINIANNLNCSNNSSGCGAGAGSSSGVSMTTGDLSNNSNSGLCNTSNNSNNLIGATGGVINNSCSGGNYTYMVTQAGQLLQFTERRFLDRWVELRTPKASSLSVNEQYIVVGCSRGIVFVFATGSLGHVCTLPLPHTLGLDLHISSNSTFESNDLNNQKTPISKRYPDVVANKYDYLHSRITCFYSDHSIIVWDIRDMKNPVKLASHLFHSGGVWSAEAIPHEPVHLSTDSESNQSNNVIDSTSFITCSDDETIRFWYLPNPTSTVLSTGPNLNDPNNNKLNTQSSTRDQKLMPTPWRNEYSKDLLKVIYTDPDLRYLLEIDRTFATKRQNATDATTNKLGIRTIRVSPDGKHLAVGDRLGNLRFYCLDTFKLVTQIAAHDGEILCIDYFQSPSTPELILFCSAARDRLIHVLDPNQDYQCIQTIDDHSGAICAARLVETPEDQEIRLISCGMDKSILLRILQPEDTCNTAQFFLYHHLVGQQSHYDMAVLPDKKFAAVVSQDRKVRVYNLRTGKQRRSYRGSLCDDGNLVSCAIDPTGTYIATAGSDKTVHIISLSNGEIICSFTGHGEPGLSLCFLNDLRHLVSVSQDSCIFIWKLPPDAIATMQRNWKQKHNQNMSNLSNNDPTQLTNLLLDDSNMSVTASIGTDSVPSPLPLDFGPPSSLLIPSSANVVSHRDTPPSIPSPTNSDQPKSISTSLSTSNVPVAPVESFRFSVSALPAWAQKKINMVNDYYVNLNNSSSNTNNSMSTVLEGESEMNENIRNNGDVKQKSSNQLRTKNGEGGGHDDSRHSRRLSFIATEKVVVNDDSDNNMEQIDDESLEKADVDTEELEEYVEEEDIDDNLDDDEDDPVLNSGNNYNNNMGNNAGVNINRSRDTNSNGFVIQTNTDTEIGLGENVMSTSAPSAFSTWLTDQNEQSPTEDDRCSSMSTRYSFDGRLPEDKNNDTLTKQRGGSLISMTSATNDSCNKNSLSSKFLTASGAARHTVNFTESSKGEKEKNKENSVQTPTNINKPEVKLSSKQKKLSKKAVSELNVNTISAQPSSPNIATKNASFKSKMSNNSMATSTTSIGGAVAGSTSKIRPDSSRSNSQQPPPPQSRTLTRKNTIPNTSTTNLTKGNIISASTVSITENSRTRATTAAVEPVSSNQSTNTLGRSRASTMSASNTYQPGTRLSYTHTQASTNRAKWSDLQATNKPKKPMTRTQRQTMPINFPTPLQSPTTTTAATQSCTTTKSTTANKHQLELNTTSTFPSTSINKTKEHVIDDIEEPSRGINIASSPTISDESSSVVNNIFSNLLIDSKNKTDSSTCSGGGGESTMEKDRITDDWILSNVCMNRSRDEIVELCTCVLKYSLSRGDWNSNNNNNNNNNNENENEEVEELDDESMRSYRLLREVEQVTTQLKSRLMNSEREHFEEMIIRDFGEKIIDEVKRKLSESFQ